jgi:hypothetical protein
MGAALFPFDDPDEKPGRLAGQFFAGFVTDDRALGSALGAMAVLRTAGDEHLASFQMFGQALASGMVGAGLFGLGQRGLFFGFRTAGLLLYFCGADAGFLKKQGRLGGGELFAFGAKEAMVQEPDFFSLELDDFSLAGVVGLQAFDRLAGVGGQCVE